MFGGEFRRWVRELERIGGCAAPVMLMGHTITRDRATGETLHVFSSADLPFGLLMVPCRNRRQEVCLTCSLLHNGDSFQIVRSGLSGGKGVPVEVGTHPRVFVTVTAPSFGLVHRAADGTPCMPRRDRPTCPHGWPEYCNVRHAPTDMRIGSALCPECYDYAGQVVWNASAGDVWKQYTNKVRREVARLGGLTVRSNEIVRHVRLSYVKVAEFQRRGAVHFHAVMRLDGPDGPGDDPPAWATASLLVEAVRAAGPKARLSVAGPCGGRVMIGLGDQLDAREIAPAGSDDSALTDQAVASYIAKYVTKGSVGALVLAHGITHPRGIELAPVTDHAKALMFAAWELGGLEEFEGLRLRAWAHQLGFRGNIVTKSRAYSTTYKALRQARADYSREAAGRVAFDPETTETESHYRLVAVGLSPQLGEIAAGIADGVAMRKGPPPGWLDMSPEL
jgi:hypothetical protein